MSEPTLPSTQPYLLRALHEWCTDNGLTPYLAVKVDGSVQVPPEFVSNGEIVLNVSYDATSKLELGNDYVEFQARFGGVPRQIVVPVHRVMAIYARENGQGMAFPVADPVLGEAGAISLEATEPAIVEEEAGASPAGAAGAATASATDAAEAAPAARKKPKAATAVKKTTRPTAVSSSGDKPQPPSPKGPAAKRPALRVVK